MCVVGVGVGRNGLFLAENDLRIKTSSQKQVPGGEEQEGREKSCHLVLTQVPCGCHGL